ncbi:hypothetical protein CRUP_012962 [Coryphaenoides rupestris]|nr:hypothetical protein CRUP_012962 [Coryphaenoides rupestris]
MDGRMMDGAHPFLPNPNPKPPPSSSSSSSSTSSSSCCVREMVSEEDGSSWTTTPRSFEEEEDQEDQGEEDQEDQEEEDQTDRQPTCPRCSPPQECCCCCCSSAPRRPGDLQENSTVRCGRASYCYGLWEVNKNEEVHLVQQGCWPHNGGLQQCHDDRCLVTTPPSQMARKEYRFCCCSRDLCNLNFTHNPLGRMATVPTLGLQPLPREETLVIAIVTVALAILLMGVLWLGYRMLKGNYKQSVVNPGVIEAANAEPIDVEDLKLLERSVYLLPLLRQHDNIAAFLGAEERMTAEGRTEYLLIMEYYPLGCLGVYLSHHSPDWLSCCRMLHSATTGLAYLHAELYRGEVYKPAVCHRDINSRNILVRRDFSCVLSDFGLSMTLTRTGLPLQGEEEHCAISEVLEGAVNLRDCESALKQVDVYALGLVYWETFRRCSDLYPTGDGVPEYQMVFQEEVGKQPSFQDMQRLVSRDKQRPSFPWKDSSLAVRSLQDTIEECWDQDAEARLTAQCAAQRLADLLAPNTRSPVLYNRSNLAEGSKMSADSSYIKDPVGVVRNITGDGHLAAVSVTTGGRAAVTEKNRNTINYQRQQAQVRFSPEGSDVALLSTISDSGGSLASDPVFLQLTQEDLEVPKLDPKEQQNLPQRPSSLLLAPTPHRAGPRNTTQVETGVAKMNVVAAAAMTEPHSVTMVTRSIPGGGGGVAAGAQALRLVANGYGGGGVPTLVIGGGGRSNPAGPQEEERGAGGGGGGGGGAGGGGGGGGGMDGGEDSSPSLLASSPDEHAPLLHPRHHHHHHLCSGTNTNTNTNNNNNNQQQQPALGSEVVHIAPPTKYIAPLAIRTAPPPGPLAPPPTAGRLSTGPGGPLPDAEPALRSGSGPTEHGAAQRPSSLDLCSSSSSGEKIKRRVKTPYALKKPRPVTWVVSMETSLDADINNHGSSDRDTFAKINQSKSSMAVFMVGGVTSGPG